MENHATITVLIPAYRAAATLGATVLSVFAPWGQRAPAAWLEVIVVDDGSPDGEDIKRICDDFPTVRLIVLAHNTGKLAAVNAGAAHSRGDVIAILDSDDTLVEDWPQVLERVLGDWPASAPVCFSACRNQHGRPTVSAPDYRGPLTLSDLLNEHRAGEYLPLFRGEILRRQGYLPVPGCAGCEMLSYLNFAREGAFWVSPEVLRIYHEGRAGAITSGWGEPDKAEAMVRCYEVIFEHFAQDYIAQAPRVWRTKRLRLAVYLMLAGRPGAWRLWRQAAAVSVWKEAVGGFIMLTLGAKSTIRLVAWLKRHGWVRRYG